MKRLAMITAAVVVLLGLLAPAALAAGVQPGAPPEPRPLLVSVDGSVDVPAGDRLDTLVVAGGNARISGEVRTIIVASGTATLAGATADTLLVVDGSADLQAGTTVRGDVRTLHGTVTRQPGATVNGSVRTLDADLAAVGLLVLPLLVLLFLGLGLAAVVAALFVAAFGARQLRATEALIRREPGQVLVAGIAGTVLLPALAVLLTVTVIGAPIGLAVLLVVLPLVAFAAWVVAAIWIGDWIVARMRGAAEPDRPYLAAVVGVIALAVAGMLPFVTAIATLFGFGALLLAAWRTLRPGVPPMGEMSPVLPAAGQG